MKTVDLFKQYKCNELQNVQGKVFTKLEKFLQRRVIQLDGNVTTAATLNIPVSLNKQFVISPNQVAPFPSLRLSSKHLYDQHHFSSGWPTTKALRLQPLQINQIPHRHVHIAPLRPCPVGHNRHRLPFLLSVF